jgi:hypothetical protein
MSDQTADSSSPIRTASTGRSSAEPQSLLQSLLKQIDEGYERGHEKLSTTLLDASVKSRVLAMLEVRHRERREPYIQQLAILQGRTQ